jgi:dihydrofolate synthase / folylpolyglutamate synthase
LTNILTTLTKISRSIHIAGTNGKGSVSHMLAAMLQLAGYKTGLYTSPHLRDFRERIRVNGHMIPEQYVVDFVAENKSLFEEIKPSFFEMTVALAFEFFRI